MFWGKGDSAKLTDRERKTLDDLRRLVETEHIIALTPDQAEIALAAIRFYSGISATTGIIAGARNVLLFIGSILVIWWAIQDWVTKFIQQAAAGG